MADLADLVTSSRSVVQEYQTNIDSLRQQEAAAEADVGAEYRKQYPSSPPPTEVDYGAMAKDGYDLGTATPYAVPDMYKRPQPTSAQDIIERMRMREEAEPLDLPAPHDADGWDYTKNLVAAAGTGVRDAAQEMVTMADQIAQTVGPIDLTGAAPQIDPTDVYLWSRAREAEAPVLPEVPGYTPGQSVLADMVIKPMTQFIAGYTMGPARALKGATALPRLAEDAIRSMTAASLSFDPDQGNIGTMLRQSESVMQVLGELGITDEEMALLDSTEGSVFEQRLKLAVEDGLVGLLGVGAVKLAAKPAKQIAEGVMDVIRSIEGSGDAKAIATLQGGQIAYHGSPHEFEKFDSKYNKTGEGANTYGHGHYFTSKKEIANWYREYLTENRRPKYSFKGKVLDDTTMIHRGVRQVVDYMNEFGYTFAAAKRVAIDSMKDMESNLRSIGNGARHAGNEERAKYYYTQADDAAKVAEVLSKAKKKDVAVPEEGSGKVYTVDIPDTEMMLDWNKTWREQTPEVQAALEKYFPNDEEFRRMEGSELYQVISGNKYKADIGGAEAAASAELRDLGIPGITYIGRTSGARNFVVFDDESIQMAKQAGEGAAETAKGYQIEVLRKGKWVDSGEGSFDTEEAALKFGNAEIGAVWRLKPPTGAETAAPKKTVATRVPGGLSEKQLMEGQVRENALEDQTLRTGLEAMKAHPPSFEKNVNLFDNYVTSFKAYGAQAPEAKANQIVDGMVENLLWLHDKFPVELRKRAGQWYPGANKMAKALAEANGLQEEQAAGVMAALSPKMDWFQNMDQAKRMMEIHPIGVEREWKSTPAMKQWANAYAERANPEVTGILDKPARTAEEKAYWIRAYDETMNERGYNILSPEGEVMGPALNNPNKKTGEQAPSVSAWQGFAHMAKAVRIIEDGSADSISNNLGQNHKVRNFFNNIIDPNDTTSVTIDTHAVAAALMRAISGSSLEAGHNFGSAKGSSKSVETGAKGTYGLYHEAYNKAAEARGISPREMQSITWEAIRGLFDSTGKKNLDDQIKPIWEQVQNGTLSRNKALEAIVELSGDFTPPAWSTQ